MEKRAKAFSTVNEYVMEFPKDVQRILGQIRHTIQKAVPGATEKISYQMPAYSLNGKTVYFAYAFTSRDRLVLRAKDVEVILLLKPDRGR